MTRSRWLVLVLMTGLVFAFFYFDLNDLLTLDTIRNEQAVLQDLVDTRPVEFVSVFFLLYVVATAVSLPGAAVTMTLVAGALLGLFWGVVVVSFASTIGATLAMVIARWLFKDQVERRFRKHLETINRGIEKDGVFYLFTLRLVPAFPFFAINLAMAVTRMPAWQFYIISQIGMLAGTIVYVNAGTELGAISSPGDILSAGLIASFVLLGVFPLLAKWLVDWMRAFSVGTGSRKPSIVMWW